MQHWTTGETEAGGRLDAFLAAPERLGSRPRAASALDRGQVFLNNQEMTIGDARRRLSLGDVVRVWIDRPGSARKPIALGARRDLPIVHEDDALIVLNKPAGVLAVPLARRRNARSVFDDLKQHLRRRGGRRPLVVHRIDRDTSGLVVFAKSAPAQAQLKAQFERREPERIYLAVVYGHPIPASGRWRDRLVWDAESLTQREAHSRDQGVKDALSEYRVVEHLRRASLMEVRLVTGRRNQIRLQARLHGHPIIGEQRYTDDRKSVARIPFPRQALHAYRLAFRHPVTGRTLRFEAPLPEDLQRLIERLRV